MRHYHLLRNHYWKPAINLDKVNYTRPSILNPPLPFSEGFNPAWLTRHQLWSLVPEETREKYLSGEAPADKAVVLDLLSLGYAKLLGKGRIPEIPLVVKARYVSREAERKIKEAGGVVELVA